MKDYYRSFALDAHREKSLGGPVLLYYSAFMSCGWELTSGFSDDDDTEETHIESLRRLVDDYHKNPNDYDHSCAKVKS